jgi:hypothetical protein
MPPRATTCASCGASLSPGASSCPACGAPVPGASSRRPSPRPAEAPIPRAPESPFATELNRRLARLTQWSESAEPLGVELPRLPSWAEEAAMHSRSPEPWAEVVRGIERLAQRRIAEAFDRWEERTTSRIVRLEAYSVDSRLERSQVEDAVHAAKLGDIAQALAMFQQVDRVVALKERHLDQARGDLERLLAFLKDLEALDLLEDDEPGEIAEELEGELRRGHLAALKQRLRLLRSQAAGRLSETFPGYVGRLGDRLLAEQRDGGGDGADVQELAIAAREVALGRSEEGVHRLRTLKEARGIPTEALRAPPRPSGSRVPPR